MRRLTRQHNIGRSLGTVIMLAQHLSMYVNYITFVMVLGTFYFSVVKLFTIPYWLFLIVMGVVLLLGLAYIWKIHIPSYMSAINQQTWEHDNPVKRELEAMERRLTELINARVGSS